MPFSRFYADIDSSRLIRNLRFGVFNYKDLFGKEKIDSVKYELFKKKFYIFINNSSFQ